ncbi:hypothetical protein ACWCQL_22415 [Streptomyces sp. NPDC002073]|uniref:hypothetical protein n=1 Tax=Streptomyces sp. NBC_00239 TaxID=2903640 RepID=UPI002E2826C2|nr:hypothetical protein [Streptomyces sp. NBC_00239]
MTAEQNGHDVRQAPRGGGGMTAFDEIYDRPDPRAFFTALGRWDYQTPHHAQAVFRSLVAARRAAGLPDDRPVLDLCCSYGINAALLNHDVTLDELYAHYTSPDAAALSTAELAARDRAFYTARRRADAVPVIGLDVAANALAYARSVGLLDAGFAENLETSPPSPELLRAVRETGLITVTGGVSFLSGRTFRALLDAAGSPVWVASFVLRTGSYEDVARALAGYGLVTRSAAEPTFRQRRFTDEAERGHAVAAVAALGLDPRGKEADGWFHTALHLSRPAAAPRP